MFFTVIIPTYNRLPILKKCLQGLEQQQLTPPMAGYEVIVVDDGSNDGTWEWLDSYQTKICQLRCFQQKNAGPAAARNLGLDQAKGDIIVFIDSDLVVTENFLQAHAQGLKQGMETLGHQRLFTYGAVINTCNFDNPTAEPYKLTDFSAAYFATGNVAIPKHLLDKVGNFDTRFKQYGWEDLELGVRLKKIGVKLIKCPEAAGYHWNPAFSLDRLPSLIEREQQRAKTGVLFYQKHPTWDVRLMIQMTVFHRALWGLLSLGGYLNERRLRGLLQWLIERGQSQLALEIARIFLNWYHVQAVRDAYRQLQQQASSSA
ncbi:glycosyltransferase family 2 protein [Geitlerinema sp. P-1104]|uniref:glycosyltransferase family 2 protein n=1 Tax=Geitlerinema sp. P-1104 TaxID=2546230 RepID=UPI001476C399|nr:glycosyltransferase family A protein [Geitlerinema sp. P-1104]NMG58312.1 glycosyltransferase family 2 protein [Geitlerinema sp. P-1104]